MSSTQQLLLGEGAGGPVSVFIEDVFSCFLYTGTGAALTITNNIDLSGKGGLVWIKNRTMAAQAHALYDTVRGVENCLKSNTTAATDVRPGGLTTFSSSGFSVGTYDMENNSGSGIVSWTFREQPKFFDVVTYTGNGTSQTISHNLGSTPGCIITKRTDTTSNWLVYHRSISTQNIYLNKTDAAAGTMGITSVGSTTYAVNSSSELNENGGTYVAYIYAHDAGGFDLLGTDNVISCGTYTGTGSPFDVTLGYEPQWVLVKKTSASGDWILMDTMRGMSITTSQWLYPNTSGAEDASGAQLNPTATGFRVTSTGSGLNGGGATYIYIAIRRGPMKTPTVGTSVFLPIAYNGTGTARNVSTGFVTDSVIAINRNAFSSYSPSWWDRLRGANLALRAYAAGAELDLTSTYELTGFDFQLGFKVGIDNVNYDINGSYATTPFVSYSFQRSPGFFDEVCYTGTGVSGQTFTHNLGVVPEMMFVKSRSGSTDWTVYHSALGASARIYLNATNAADTGTASPWNSTTPTSSVFSLGNAGATNNSGATFINYLFATVAGVSKVGSYTGTGALLTVACGFTSGARFVLIKRTDSTGDWYVYDSARGITSGNDPYVLINSQAAEVTGTNYVDTDTTGFQVTAAAPAGLNANGGTYIFLAIA